MYNHMTFDYSIQYTSILLYKLPRELLSEDRSEWVEIKFRSFIYNFSSCNVIIVM